MARITNVRVEQLLDYFDHEIEFPPAWHYILLYGPNGVGKTKLLELLHSVYRCEFDAAIAIPFQRLTVGHEDGSVLQVRRSQEPGNSELKLDIDLQQVGQTLPLPGLESTLSGQYFDFGGSRIRQYLLERSTWRPVTGSLWRDMDDGEYADWDELLERFRGIADRSGVRLVKNPEIPRTITKFLQATPTHFIATQRLLYTMPQRRRFVNRDGASQQITIAAYSDDLKMQLSRALTENSKRTQQLDRSFPKRVLEMNRHDIDSEEIRERYEEQSKKRSELAEIGLIGWEVDLPLPNRDLNSWELNVLQTYLDDTDQKLQTFDDIAARVSLLREIANNRFFNKTLTVSIEEGIIVKRNSDGMVIPPTSLSSGEQHELVLLYDLLFNVSRNALVLIDEPEISLHIAWQKSFINDIARIAELASLRFIIATHSPQIINKSWDQTAELGPHMHEDPQ
ncbi:Predicted ATP-binding protein involved in virulence [Mycobacteroides abscessus subsp. abscessus]|uniref:AAA family ATPase n=1 Tax=Mycobacteroides abscessus TaxID=36809 RepID=UPI0009283D08|nr:AAA family ATPase [Mycobacteroides abscessus]MBN7303846.1 AAA family ATPase [Mycobacteroides abscessus subsp. bolletii]SHR09098.1 Predicted ATP-binding protein involved in virulence [Mycobacteroides abscessus subsp. abscessus]SLE73605.1 Predicted ATP-binding protein involved in virulence [Mycobacteroides abscessus subsp. abscessus]SLF01169.1 Predicted ATP-binding protein involved in virulence [Mycobacteroides abscessus subsp. abscessus]SLF18463.1 Predicted ATP-binding protein involved in vi